MELVEGDTLAERLSGGALPVADALRIGAGIVEALEVAHEKGVIHRDLKPANIKLNREGKVKVLDFGLAKAMDLPFAGDVSRTPTLVLDDSRPGDIVGTPEFMSPEQARGKEVDRRTDIWAFGCILFEMLSGKRAFTGETIPDVLLAIIDREPDWAALPVRTPPRVRELLARCLEKDPAQRLRDSGDARLELEAAIAGLSSARTLASASPPRKWNVVLTVTAGVLVLAAGGYLISRSRKPAEIPKPGRQLAVLPFRNLTGVPDGELWGLGLVATVSARLADVPGLQVVTPRAAVEAADENPNFVRVAQNLGANTLLAGTLQREKERFRITYRLVDAKGQQLAAAAIDGSELFELQDLVADGVLRDLQLRRGQRRTPTPSGLDMPAQQELYLQAVGLLQRYDRREGVEKAVEILRGLARERPNSPLVQAALGRASLAMFDFTKDRKWSDTALEAAETAHKLDPALPEVDVTLGETLLLTGRTSEAIATFRRALAARPTAVDACLGLGTAAEIAGDRATAENAFRRAVSLQPSFAVFNQLGVLYASRGRWTDAIAMFRRATEVAPDSYRAFSNLGAVCSGACDFPAAEAAFRRALTLRPGDPVSSSNLGLMQLWTGRAAEAVASLEGAARDSPNDPQITAAFGDALSEIGATERAAAAYGRAIALAREALRLNSSDPTAHSVLATSLARTGKRDEAGAEMQAALDIDDREPNVLADAATVAALCGKPAEALAFLRRAVDAGYCRQILKRQPEFASLRQSPEFESIVAGPRKAAGTS